ncbi:MAG: type II toxin-antitoxin system VapC family toxin [Xanthomonadales bacterium]|nr:type II toxin-antitoxin system VapC family toxin [Xanthomonadales bacterium]MBK7145521.1 type II toxin-antitoxin system VapC family toxin [Xanthomonadales bacterium]MCC6560193.1 type II toxin-antitoxin system VapC family toxin [Xanthomonadales bacterium]
MIGIDTNVLVRYLVQDEPVQARLATRLIQDQLSDRQPGFISIAVLLETLWILRSRYRVAAPERLNLLRMLLDVRQLQVEHRTAVARALMRIDGRGDRFNDALVVEIAREAGCSQVASFDQGACRYGMTLLK